MERKASSLSLAPAEWRDKRFGIQRRGRNFGAICLINSNRMLAKKSGSIEISQQFYFQW
jgi:hypothetical protein